MKTQKMLEMLDLGNSKSMGKKILIVDDESSIREALSKILQVENYEVFPAENGQEAIEKFNTTWIDLVLLDVGLPVKDGWRVLEWLARVNPFLPVIIITGRSHQHESAERLGAAAIMEKPLNVPRLLNLVRELTGELAEYHPRPASNFQHIPCDQELVLKSLNEHPTAPLTRPEPKSH